VDGRRCRDDLERRSGRITGLRGPVEGRDVWTFRVRVVVVVARDRDHHLHGSGARVERDDGPRLAAELLLRDPLGRWVERGVDVIADSLPAHRTENRAETL